MDFANIPRGEPVEGASALAEYFFGDKRKQRRIYGMDLAAYGIVNLSGHLIGWTGWMGAGLAAKAKLGERRRHRRSQGTVA
jgi:hypothetical protein